LLDAQIPSRGLSAGVVPRFDAVQPYLGSHAPVAGALSARSNRFP
jgi:hypothetical protein